MKELVSVVMHIEETSRATPLAWAIENVASLEHIVLGAGLADSIILEIVIHAIRKAWKVTLALRIEWTTNSGTHFAMSAVASTKPRVAISVLVVTIDMAAPALDVVA